MCREQFLESFSLLSQPVTWPSGRSMPPWWLWTTTSRARPRSSGSNWKNRYLNTSNSEECLKTLCPILNWTNWSYRPKKFICKSVYNGYLFSSQRLDLFVPLHLETCSNVPAYGRLLSASGNPMQCQIPFIPQAQRRICTVNSLLIYLLTWLILVYIRRNSTALACVFSLSTRGGFIALSPISPQDMFLQPFSCSREEKEEEDVDYHSPYHPYHHPHAHHLHLHNLVKNI